MMLTAVPLFDYGSETEGTDNTLWLVYFHKEGEAPEVGSPINVLTTLELLKEVEIYVGELKTDIK